MTIAPPLLWPRMVSASQPPQQINTDQIAGQLKRALALEARPLLNITPPSDRLVTAQPDPEQRQRWRRIGADLIQAGQVAAITMAGGQGTRLGSSLPKGCFDIGLSPPRSLFQLQAERLRRASQHCPIPWLIMTSPATDEATKRFFEEHDHFGYGPDNVFFFQQGVLPALTESGQLIESAERQPILSPNGNGGIFAALKASVVVSRLFSERHIKYVHVFSVDNVLVKPADPVFVGFCHEKRLDVGSKSVLKRDAHEKAGVFAQTATGQLRIAEYTELPQQNIDAFVDANIANHVFSADFLDKCAHIDLPCHIARKSIPIGDGRSVMGIKLEMFIFDALQHAQSAGVLRVDRAAEFSPLKNATGEDSAETCLRDLLRTGGEC